MPVHASLVEVPESVPLKARATFSEPHKQPTRFNVVAHRLQSIATHLLGLIFLLWASFYLLTALCAIANFAWRQPMFDQYHSYPTFLTLPFPQNILQLDNGHRPIIPNLFRLAEIHWFAADQLLQISVGTSCALLTVGIVAVSVVRNRELPPAVRAAGIMLAVIGIFWLANARMLLHGNESLHAYLVTLMVTCAGLFTWKASLDRPLRWLSVASAACVVAMFSFGPGVASFPAVMMLSVLLRLRWRCLLIPTTVLTLCLLLYLFVLPGDQGVRNVLDIRPFASLATTAQWLASPWANAWLGLADPPVQSWLPTNLQTSMFGRFLTGSASDMTSISGIAWQSITAGLGYAGIVVFLVRISFFYRRHSKLSRTQALAITLCLFVLATAAIIGIGRLDYLVANPGQIYADRYLMWPCLFWMALTLLLLIDLSRIRNHAAVVSGLLALILLPIAMLPTHRAWANWAAAIYQRSQQSAAAARSDVFDAGLFPNGVDASRDAVLQTLALFKKYRLAMFADPGWEALGTRWDDPLQRNAGLVAGAHILNVFDDPLSGMRAARIEGTVTHGISAIRHDDELAIVDASNNLVGFADFSFIKTDSHALRIGIPRKRGFDGYIRDYRDDRRYRLVLLRNAQSTAWLLADIPSHRVEPWNSQ